MSLLIKNYLPLTLLFAACVANSQEPVQISLPPTAATATTEVPRLVSYSGVATAIDGKALTGDVPVGFLLYKGQEGGEPLWSETQVVSFDVSGHYQVRLGAAAPLGLPLDTFASGEGRWLEVQIAGQQPQQRVLLVSVPYAMKAADAATLGGLPASAFLRAGTAGPVSIDAPDAAAAATSSTVTTPGGNLNRVPVFTGASTVGNSMIYTSATSVGIGLAPSIYGVLDVGGQSIFRGPLNVARTGNASASAGTNSNPFEFSFQFYNSAAKFVYNPYFSFQAEATGNNTANPAGTMNLLYYNGIGGVPKETGLYFNPDGTIHFASGQMYPGAAVGTVTGVTAGTDLSGGGKGGIVTLNLDTTKVPLIASTNTFTAAQTITVGAQSAQTALTATGPTGISGVSNNFGAGVMGSGGYQGVAGSGVIYGVYGQGVQVDSIGVYGVGGGPSSLGLGLGAGVVGTSNVGVIGYSTESAPPLSSGSYAITAGIYAQAGSLSNEGATNRQVAGLVADGGATTGSLDSQIAVEGTTDDAYAGFFINASSNDPSVVAENDAGGPLFTALGNGKSCNIDGQANLECSGTISGLNLVADKRALTTYGVQAAENWYEDASSGQLHHGVAHVVLEPSFGAVVDTEVEYHVFLTPNGESNNLYVTNKTPNGFDVREAAHGTSSIGFDYRIMAKRKGYEQVRLEDVTEKLKARQDRQLNMHQGRTGAGGVPAPSRVRAAEVGTPAMR